MKKKLFILFLLIMAISTSSMTYAAEGGAFGEEVDAKIGVGFGETTATTEVTKPKPSVYEPGIKPGIDRMLPKTNELLQTLVVLLVGIALLLIVFGLFVIKKVYSKRNNFYLIYD